jgi:acyl CoA:acetate/3-ketoacid CoA transferase alpha subunit
MAAAARLTIAEVVQTISAEGSLNPEEIVTSGIYVDRVVQASSNEHRGVDAR